MHRFIYSCPISLQIKIKLERYIAFLLKTPIHISTDTSLYKDTSNTPEGRLILNMLCIYKEERYTDKTSLDVDNAYLSDKTTFPGSSYSQLRGTNRTMPCGIPFMNLFRAEGPFSFVKKEIFGVTQVHHSKNICLITFKPKQSAEQMHFFKMRFMYRQFIHLYGGTEIGITVQDTRPQATALTLNPIPFETTLDEIAKITKQQWDKLLGQQFGHYRDFPEFHNSYLHLLIEDIKEENLPEKITINEKPVEIILPRTKRNKCNYYKAIRAHPRNDPTCAAKN
ncbi:unnamed protein product [Clavelina lepadiformis]|uniref:Uncharacterized protein n=1 Tax=Clavelina lepadiformis TaxID=159417 RepID=A0ABP0G1U2_CLALP